MVHKLRVAQKFMGTWRNPRNDAGCLGDIDPLGINSEKKRQYMSMVGSPLSSYEITFIELSICINHIHINPISCFHPIYIYPRVFDTAKARHPDTPRHQEFLEGVDMTSYGIAMGRAGITQGRRMADDGGWCHQGFSNSSQLMNDIWGIHGLLTKGC